MNDKDILTEARERLKKCIDDNSANRKLQKDDLRFCTLDQWPPDIRASRENDVNGPRPCLTIDQINQYLDQVVNDGVQNRPAVKVRPVDDHADVQTAEIFQGIIRQIEDQSMAEIAYGSALRSAVRIGEGYFRIVTEYENDKSFKQVIRIKPIQDTFCCYLGYHVMPDGSDAEYGFVFEDVPQETFRRLYPEAKYQSTDFNDIINYSDYWLENKKIRVAEYFYFDYQEEELVFTEDGRELTRKEYETLPEPKARISREDGEEITRQTRIKSVKWCKLTGIEILQKRDWAGQYIPIIKVIGKESWSDGARSVWGLVRPAKDSLRMYNYIASTITEKWALVPKTPFIGAKGQFEGMEDRWANANRVNYAYLEYNPLSVDGLSVPPPQRQPPAAVEVALIQQLQIAREDVQASLGMYRAALGKEQPNQSGKAILALTRESDTGTFHFSNNQKISIQYGGRILIDLIPKIMDVKSIVRILGEDGKMKTAQLDPGQEVGRREVEGEDGIRAIYNLGVGTYDVTATVGPSFNTKRMEAATLFTDLATNAKDPQISLVANYWAIKNSDFNGSQKAAEMIEKLMPPGMIQKEGEPEIPPEIIQKMQQMEQLVQAMGQENQELKSGTREALAKIQSDAESAQAKLQLEARTQASKLQFEREKFAQEIELERAKVEAQLEIEKMKAAISAESDVDKAIGKVKNMSDAFLLKTTGLVEQSEIKAEGDAKGEMKDSVAKLQGDFLQGVKEIVESLQAKKTVTMTMDGRKATAIVTPG